MMMEVKERGIIQLILKMMKTEADDKRYSEGIKNINRFHFCFVFFGKNFNAKLQTYTKVDKILH